MPGLTTGAADIGNDGIDAEESSIDPNVTAEPCLTAPTVLLGTLTPSLTGTP